MKNKESRLIDNLDVIDELEPINDYQMELAEDGVAVPMDMEVFEKTLTEKFGELTKYEKEFVPNPMPDFDKHIQGKIAEALKNPGIKMIIDGGYVQDVNIGKTEYTKHMSLVHKIAHYVLPLIYNNTEGLEMGNSGNNSIYVIHRKRQFKKQ